VIVCSFDPGAVALRAGTARARSAEEQVIDLARDVTTIVGIVVVPVAAILLGLTIVAGITHTYMTRPALIEAAAKQVPDTRQLFEATFL
jgi:hypothetical protein